MTTEIHHDSPLLNGWCQLSRLYERVQAHVERALLAGHAISLREYFLLTVLSHQHDGHGGHLHMKQVSEAVVLSQSATTRLVTRLEERGLLARCMCPTDRRGIYTNVTEAGFAMIASARPTHDLALEQVLGDAQKEPRLEALFASLEQLGAACPAAR